MDNNVLVYPILKRRETKEFSNEEVDIIVKHYMNQLLSNFSNHGFELNSEFSNDMKYVAEFMRSALFRNVGKYHPLQEYINDYDAFNNNDNGC